MNLQERIDLLQQVGNYMQGNDERWELAMQKASVENAWFTREFIILAIKNIAENFLQKQPLEALARQYSIPEINASLKRIGIVMAGNIPLVGFHDLLCVFLTGHYAVIKPSSKDDVLIRHLTDKLMEWNRAAVPYFTIAERLNNCDAYIATGSDNTARYFEYYFRKYPHIIRKNRTSVAVLTGKESKEELEALADDVHQYFGLGCRNVTKLYVPEGYDFVPLLDAFRKYSYLIDHNKYKNNYDYRMAAHILNNQFYMTNDSVLLVENKALFAPISQVHYEYYQNEKDVQESLQKDDTIQCIVGREHVPFGQAQCPAVNTFADGVDTIHFLMNLGSDS
ncbi:MAG: acyl-CoA reductase [Flavisolibacter sp.]|nr:acyl-CoA reductase [Flavisolibacter sp.]MBD0351522.1 acyl-CoA reductase [Flavisolibacter sp.]MBD0377792.1 acyl-CoA reductase [Flavisolibacter sp.]